MRWFFCIHATNNISVFQTDEYSPEQGHATETEAIAAALKLVNTLMTDHASKISSWSSSLAKLASETEKLARRLNEIHNHSND